MGADFHCYQDPAVRLASLPAMWFLTPTFHLHSTCSRPFVYTKVPFVHPLTRHRGRRATPKACPLVFSIGCHAVRDESACRLAVLDILWDLVRLLAGTMRTPPLSNEYSSRPTRDGGS